MGKSEDKSEGTTGEDIGRPGPWGEGRYQKPGQSVDESVRTPPGSVPDADKRSSTPVTRRDYESSGRASPKGDSDVSGGDAGPEGDAGPGGDAG
jgi:hypothetical protein